MNRVWRLIGSLGGSKMAEAFFITLATNTIIDIISAPLYSALLQSQYQPLKVDNPNLYTLLLNDSRNLYIDTSDIRSNELGGLFLNACTGLYFLLAIDEAHRPTIQPRRMEHSDQNLYLRAWRYKMIQIWQDRLDLLGVHDTGALRRSVQAGATNLTPGKQNLTFRFLEYDIYVDLGVGNGYRHNNGGDLKFLGKAYRTLHHMGKPRERRPWFNRSWYISVEVLKNHLANILGDQFAGAFDNLTDRQRG